MTQPAGPPPARGGRLARARRWPASLALALALAGCGEAAPAGSRAAPSTAPAATNPAERAGQASATPVAPPAPPVRIEIATIGVSAPVVRLGLHRDGTMEVPDDFQAAGWFTGGPVPGETGPAVVAGHIDSRTGPAVFYRVRELRPGDGITVVRADGTSVRFAVVGVAQYPKRAFPTEAVFGPTPEPLLRLITCGGSFDRSQRSYRDNLVVTARLVTS